MTLVPKIFISWIGEKDLKAITTPENGIGSVAGALTLRQFDHAYLLTARYPMRDVALYTKWLKTQTKTPFELLEHKFDDPTDFAAIYEVAVGSIERALTEHQKDVALTFNFSSGTPTMRVVWFLLSKTRFRAEVVHSSKAHGVQTLSIPFDIAADFIPDLLREQDERLRQGSSAPPPESPEFVNIVHRSRVMSRLIQRARRVAAHNVPVLIEGESGTGKEMLARAIHGASPRRDGQFIPVNCGAIPTQLIESELFGHEKGAFTDAKQARKGYFEEADGGTLFLDEIGELPAAAQVKLLRAVQSGDILRVGTSRTIKVDVRIVAATNRTLSEEIGAGRFREDLFYRLAVAVLRIPPLRERAGDLSLLIDHALAQTNQGASAPESSQKDKKLSAGAKNILLAHPWPGNVRELINTLQRAAIWSDSEVITAEDVREALLPVAGKSRNDVLDRSIGNGFNLQNILRDVARHYLSRAINEAHGNKTKAAELVGLPSYQTLSNWLTKYEVEG
jgi:DNA-binding NtrC family response regulator